MDLLTAGATHSLANDEPLLFSWKAFRQETSGCATDQPQAFAQHRSHCIP